MWYYFPKSKVFPNLLLIPDSSVQGSYFLIQIRYLNGFGTPYSKGRRGTSVGPPSKQNVSHWIMSSSDFEQSLETKTHRSYHVIPPWFFIPPSRPLSGTRSKNRKNPKKRLVSSMNLNREHVFIVGIRVNVSFESPHRNLTRANPSIHIRHNL